MKSGQRLKELIAQKAFFVIALTSIVAVLLICIFLFAGGIPAMAKVGLFDLLLGKEWSPSDIPPAYGLLPMILGSIYMTLGAIIVGVPIGILTSVFLARFCPKGLYKFLKPVVELLAGIPSIVYGFFGMIVIVPLVGRLTDTSGNSLFTGSILLGIMILPTIIGVSQAAIDAVPDSYYEGALALGATHERAVFFTVLPAAKSGVMAAVVLGIGRAIGETMAVIMVAGNQPRMPGGLFEGVRTLTANIVIEMGYATDLHREVLIATGVILFAFILIINFTFARIKRRMK